MSKVQTSTEFLSLMYLKLPDLFYDMQLTILGIQGGHYQGLSLPFSTQVQHIVKEASIEEWAFYLLPPLNQ